MTRILIWAQHLLGTGHTVRAAAIATALKEAGAEPTLVLGAAPPATLDLSHLSVEALPAVLATDGSFTRIEAADGTPYQALARERTHRLLALIERFSPDLVLTETFPFGRRAFASELVPAIEAARARGALIVSSVRDVLQRKSAQKEAEMVRLARAHYRAVLVHADPHFVTLGDSFRAAPRIADLIRYTGYVDAAAPAGPAQGRSGVLVSAGGSAVGAALIETAIDAARRGPPDLFWRILVSNALRERLPVWQAAAPDNAMLEPNRPDFRALLAAAEVSVSQAGYNTVLDVLCAGPRAIFVPFAAHEESEQTDRAAALAARGLAHVVPEDALTAPRLAAAVRAALDAPPPPEVALDRDGARKSAAMLMELAA